MFLFRDSLPKIKGYIRFLHSVPDASDIDIYLNDKIIFTGLSFGNITHYIPVTAETYSVKLYKSGSKDTLYITESLQVLPDSISTVNITLEDKKIAFFSVDDSHTMHNPTLSYIRFINLAPTAPLLSLRLPDNRVLFNETSYLETNNYYPTSAGVYDFIVSTSDGNFNKYISNINLTPNLYITIYIIGLYDDTPSLGYILVKDGLKTPRHNKT